MNGKKAGFIRVFAGVVAIALASLVFVVGLALGWFFFYSAALPDIHALARYAPVQAGCVSDPCLGESTAIPYDAIGDNLRAALDVAEGNLGPERHHRTTMSTQISRSMFCTPSKELRRHIEEARAAAQIQRQFSATDKVTIFANRTSFGNHLIGVEAASEYLFHKGPAQLNIEEAALLAGLIKAPSRYSPVTHPERALQRRNEVIEALVESHKISADQAAAAETASLRIAVK